jgi:hypothetical protein
VQSRKLCRIPLRPAVSIPMTWKHT